MGDAKLFILIDYSIDR